MRRKKEEIEVKDENVLEIIRKSLDSDKLQIKRDWWLSTGFYSLNYIISNNLDYAIPGGTVVEFYGEPSTGKTLLMTCLGIEVQKLGGIFILADVERRFDANFASSFGLDLEKTLVFHPVTVEEFTINVFNLLNQVKNHKLLIGLDSLGALTTEQELEAIENSEMKADQGRKAQKVKMAMRVLSSKLMDSQAILLITNHVMDVPSSYIPLKVVPGGRGVPFQASIRIECGKPKYITKDSKQYPIGVILNCKVTKNSIAPPNGETSLIFYWTHKDQYSGLLELAYDLEIIEKNGNMYSYNGKSFYGKDFPKIFEEYNLKEHPNWKNPYFLNPEKSV